MEAGKEFVDLLFGFLLLPAGTVVRILAGGEGSRCSNLSSIANVYKSAEKLKDCAFARSKKILLEAQPANGFSSGPLSLEGSSPEHNYRLYKCGCTNPTFTIQEGLYCSQCQQCASEELRLFKCNCGRTVSTFPSGGPSCPHCRTTTSAGLEIVNGVVGDFASDQKLSGFVKENVTFMITDDLEVKPASTIESIMLLNKLKVEKLSLLNSVEVSITAKEALDLLQASFTSRTALTDVFSANVSLKRQSVPSNGA